MLSVDVADLPSSCMRRALANSPQKPMLGCPPSPVQRHAAAARARSGGDVDVDLLSDDEEYEEDPNELLEMEEGYQGEGGCIVGRVGCKFA